MKLGMVKHQLKCFFVFQVLVDFFRTVKEGLKEVSIGGGGATRVINS